MSAVEGHPAVPGEMKSARDAALAVVRALRAEGYIAYFAGGCVRDQLLGIEPKDYDVATDALPESVKKIFPKARLVGESFGVVLVKRFGHFIEVATFRSEGVYEDGRRPSEVSFTDAARDAERRDFTINGLFYDPIDEHVIDHVGGEADLQRKLIRAIGDADARFGEDYLRMLRAVRFAGRLDFALEKSTADAIRTHAGKLTKIVRERIGQELRLMFAAKSRARAAALLQSLDLDGPVLCETHADAPLLAIDGLGDTSDFACALAAWLLDRARHVAVGEAADEAAVANATPRLLADLAVSLANDAASRAREALCLSNEETDGLRMIFELIPRAIAWPELSVADRKRLLADDAWSDARLVLGGAAAHFGVSELLAQLDEDEAALLVEGVAPEPWLSGDDLIAAGLSPGPAFGRLLYEAYDLQLSGELTSRAAALAWLASQ